MRPGRMMSGRGKDSPANCPNISTTSKMHFETRRLALRWGTISLSRKGLGWLTLVCQGWISLVLSPLPTSEIFMDVSWTSGYLRRTRSWHSKHSGPWKHCASRLRELPGVYVETFLSMPISQPLCVPSRGILCKVYRYAAHKVPLLVCLIYHKKKIGLPSTDSS